MPEPEEIVSDVARHATVFVRDLWRRQRERVGSAPTVGLADVAARIDLFVTSVFGRRFPIRVAAPPAPPPLPDRVFGRRRGPVQRRPLPATDGTSLWLPADLGLTDLELALERYRALALAQAMRATRGGAALVQGEPSPLVRDCFLLLEASAADAALARLLPAGGGAPGARGPPPAERRARPAGPGIRRAFRARLAGGGAAHRRRAAARRHPPAARDFPVPRRLDRRVARPGGRGAARRRRPRCTGRRARGAHVEHARRPPAGRAQAEAGRGPRPRSKRAVDGAGGRAAPESRRPDGTAAPHGPRRPRPRGRDGRHAVGAQGSTHGRDAGA